MAISIGRWRGLREIRGEVLSDNHKMLALSRKLGFTVNYPLGGITGISLSLDA